MTFKRSPFDSGCPSSKFAQSTDNATAVRSLFMRCRIFLNRLLNRINSSIFSLSGRELLRTSADCFSGAVIQGKSVEMTTGNIIAPVVNLPIRNSRTGDFEIGIDQVMSDSRPGNRISSGGEYEECNRPKRFWKLVSPDF